MPLGKGSVGPGRSIGVRAVVGLVADGIIIGLQAPNPLVELKVVAEIDAADEIAIVGAVAIVKGLLARAGLPVMPGPGVQLWQV